MQIPAIDKILKGCDVREEHNARMDQMCLYLTEKDQMGMFTQAIARYEPLSIARARLRVHLVGVPDRMWDEVIKPTLADIAPLEGLVETRTKKGVSIEYTLEPPPLD